MRRPRILVLEDEPLIAMDLAAIIEGLGAEVIGPALNLTSAERLAATNDIDFAFLDYNLKSDTSAAFARTLELREIEFAFVTAYRRSTIDDQFHDVTLIKKPFRKNEIQELLRNVFYYIK